MTIAFTGVDGFFTYLGKEEAALLDLQALRGGTATARVLTQASLKTRLESIVTGHASGTRKDPLLSGLFPAYNAMDAAMIQYGREAAQRIQNTLIEMIRADTGRLDLTLAEAVYELNRQLEASGNSVNATPATIGSQTNLGSPTGTSIITACEKDGRGRSLEYVYPETITFRCTKDAGLNANVTSGQEEYTAIGKYKLDPFHRDWPGGSGARITLFGVDSTLNYGGRNPNVLQNSDFADTTNGNGNFDNWVIVTGSAGTTITSGGVGYRNSTSMAFTGDGGGTLSQIRQQFNTAPSTTLAAGGTAFLPKALTNYHLNFWLKCNVVPAAGVLTFDLYNGSAVVADASSTNQTLAVDLTAATTDWVNYNVVFRLPATVPSSLYLRIRLSTAITNTRIVYVSDLSMAPGQLFYPNGPTLAAFTGTTRPVVNDAWTRAVTGLTLNGIQSAAQRYLNLNDLQLRLATNNAGSETILDTLVM